MRDADFRRLRKIHIPFAKICVKSAQICVKFKDNELFISFSQKNPIFTPETHNSLIFLFFMKKYLLLFCLAFAAMSTYSQSILGVNFSIDYNLWRTRLATLAQGDTLKSIAQDLSPIKTGGLSLGFPVNIRLAKWLTLRPALVANIAFAKFDYQFKSGFSNSIAVRQVNLEIPIQFLICNLEKKKSFAVMLGIRAGHTFDSGYKNNDTPPITFNPTYGVFDAGIGYCIRYNKTHFFMPELRYSIGLGDVMKYTSSPYSRVLESIHRDRIALAFNFF